MRDAQIKDGLKAAHRALRELMWMLNNTVRIQEYEKRDFEDAMWDLERSFDKRENDE